ncbi:hypothetical protein Q3G72_021946 [Acer saccharum]|nr:hypothetical protein Q3G72_021946 [Acer saccharum]
MNETMHKAPKTRQLSDSNRRIIDSNPQTLRLYQVWRGSNRFYCGGRIIFGPDVRSIFFTISLIVIPVILFCAFVSQTLIKEFQHQLGDLIVAICAVFTVYVIFLLLLTSGIDPGIIPRNSNPPDLDDDGSTVSSDWMGSQGNGSNLPPTKDVIVNGVIVKVKYCQTCMLYRPPRCSHCSICNNCVERFDHHCPWVGQCIGKTTYENFRYRYNRKMNPYNHGCMQNVLEVFCSKFPRSKNNFREKVKVDSSSIFAHSLSLCHSTNPEVPKKSFDIETGKRQAVALEDFEDMQNQLDSVGRLERCEIEPRHRSQEHKADWENTTDIRPKLLTVERKFMGGVRRMFRCFMFLKEEGILWFGEARRAHQLRRCLLYHGR